MNILWQLYPFILFLSMMYWHLFEVFFRTSANICPLIILVNIVVPFRSPGSVLILTVFKTSVTLSTISRVENSPLKAHPGSLLHLPITDPLCLFQKCTIQFFWNIPFTKRVNIFDFMIPLIFPSIYSILKKNFPHSILDQFLNSEVLLIPHGLIFNETNFIFWYGKKMFLSFIFFTPWWIDIVSTVLLGLSFFSTSEILPRTMNALREKSRGWRSRERQPPGVVRRKGE